MNCLAMSTALAQALDKTNQSTAICIHKVRCAADQSQADRAAHVIAIQRSLNVKISAFTILRTQTASGVFLVMAIAAILQKTFAKIPITFGANVVDAVPLRLLCQRLLPHKKTAAQAWSH